VADIWRYTANGWGLDQADDYLRQIAGDLTRAAKGSPMVRVIDALWRMKSGRHLCVFAKLDDGTIEVIRVLHERRDIRSHLP
jgi:toxin ParE1/3/4